MLGFMECMSDMLDIFNISIKSYLNLCDLSPRDSDQDQMPYPAVLVKVKLNASSRSEIKQVLPGRRLHPATKFHANWQWWDHSSNCFANKFLVTSQSLDPSLSWLHQIKSKVIKIVTNLTWDYIMWPEPTPLPIGLVGLAQSWLKLNKQSNWT